MNFGKNLIKLRASKNLSQESLAEKIGVTRQSISNWENGDLKPDIEKTVQIAKVFSVDINDLVSGEVGKASKKKTRMTSRAIRKMTLLICGFFVITYIGAIVAREFNITKIDGLIGIVITCYIVLMITEIILLFRDRE
jgi:transcriptional regulator with XRE-family HTH domain